MARLSELSTRLHRLIHGEFRHEDLTWLVLGLRDRCHGIHSVRELGDFIAHRDIRNKGPIAHHVRLFFCIFRMNLESIKIGGELDPENLHPYIKKVVLHNLRQPSSNEILAQLGVKRRAAQNIVDSFVKSLSFDDAGSVRSLKTFSKQEWSLIHSLTLRVISEAGFLEDQLWSEFLQVLEKNGLVNKGNIYNVFRLKPAFSLFVLSLLHGIRIEIDSDWYAFVYLDENEGKLVVRALAEIPRFVPRRVFGFVLYSTSLKRCEWCPACDFSSRDENWSRTFEIDRSMNLKVVE